MPYEASGTESRSIGVCGMISGSAHGFCSGTAQPQRRRLRHVIDVEGVTVPRVLVLELAHRLERDGYFNSANLLLRCLSEGEPVALPTADKRIVLQALDDHQEGLEELRGALLRSLWSFGFLAVMAYTTRCGSHESSFGRTIARTTMTRSARSTSRTSVTYEGAHFELRNWDIRYPQGQDRITDAFYDEVAP